VSVTPTHANDARLQQAALWWAKFQDCEPAAEDLTAWLAWMEEDASNAEAFQSLNELALRIKHTRVEAPESLERLKAAVRRRTVWPKVAVAASMVAVATVIGIIAPNIRVHSTPSVPRSLYSTAIAGQRDVRLPDGSHVILGGASTIDTDFSAERRLVRLSAGEAYFEVQHETSGRPFIVDTGMVTVRAVGTAFDVRTDDKRVAITVTEGRVKVDRVSGVFRHLAMATGIAKSQSLEVGRGEQVVIAPANAPVARPAADPAIATAWRHGRLEFVDEPLDSVIASVSRYSAMPLRSDDPRIQAMTYTGSFEPEHLDSWLGALERVFPVKVIREGDSIQVRAKNTPQ
jgi:transmembrane sensor